jgi:hypothetical protein
MSEMSEMVERVAREMENIASLKFGVSLNPQLSAELARAAIAAMREPTQGMVQAGESYSLDITAYGAAEVWQDMIDAALAP